MLRNKFATLICFFLFGIVSLASATSVPEWLRAAAQQPVKKYADDVNAVTLLNETETTVKDNGETVTRVRRVVKVLRPDGREKAFVGVPFDDETRLNYFKGWSISASGQEYEAKKDNVVEMAAGEGYEVYSDEKAKVMRIPGVDVGTIVGVEYEQKRHPYTFEDQWYFQFTDPLVTGRYILHLPPGWEFRAAWMHHPEQDYVRTGNTYTWEVSNVPRIEREDEMPHWRALAGQLIVTFFSEKTKNRSYANWSDFAAWYSQLTANVRDSSPAMQQKVQQLAPANMPSARSYQGTVRFCSARCSLCCNRNWDWRLSAASGKPDLQQPLW